MIFTEFSMSNFGLHKKVTANIPSSVVGLIGPNASGKSTVLKGIEYLLTGELPGEASTWIRNGGVEILPDGTEVKTKAVLEGKFIKGGMVGTIRREITLTKSSRLLVWQGKEIKSAKEVKDTLYEILEADSRALKECVFLAQGELAELLFGGAPEREQMFVRLLLMGFMQNVSDISQRERSKLLSEVEDLSVIKDEVMSQRRDFSAKSRIYPSSKTKS